MTTKRPIAKISGIVLIKKLSKTQIPFKNHIGNSGIFIFAMTPPESGKIKHSFFSFFMIFKFGNLFLNFIGCSNSNSGIAQLADQGSEGPFAG